MGRGCDQLKAVRRIFADTFGSRSRPNAGAGHPVAANEPAHPAASASSAAATSELAGPPKDRNALFRAVRWLSKQLHPDLASREGPLASPQDSTPQPTPTVASGAPVQTNVEGTAASSSPVAAVSPIQMLTGGTEAYGQVVKKYKQALAKRASDAPQTAASKARYDDAVFAASLLDHAGRHSCALTFEVDGEPAGILLFDTSGHPTKIEVMSTLPDFKGVGGALLVVLINQKRGRARLSGEPVHLEPFKGSVKAFKALGFEGDEFRLTLDPRRSNKWETDGSGWQLKSYAGVVRRPHAEPQRPT